MQQHKAGSKTEDLGLEQGTLIGDIDTPAGSVTAVLNAHPSTFLPDAQCSCPCTHMYTQFTLLFDPKNYVATAGESMRANTGQMALTLGGFPHQAVELKRNVFPI